MSMDIYYKLKEERVHLISVLKELDLAIQVVNGKIQFSKNEDFKIKLQKKIDFIYYRKCEAEKRIIEINAKCRKIGRHENEKLLRLKIKRLIGRSK
jgi:hypothetical protein